MKEEFRVVIGTDKNMFAVRPDGSAVSMCSDDYYDAEYTDEDMRKVFEVLSAIFGDESLKGEGIDGSFL
jgi:hypothetical protein